MQGTGGFLNPKKVLLELDIVPPVRIAHFGCGHGYFTIPLAKLIGEEGHIYAVDILQDALTEVEAKAQSEGLKNIQTIKGDLEVPGGSKVPDESCDLALLANVLFQSKKKESIILEARRILRAGGRLIIIDWEFSAKLTSDSGWRITESEAQILAQDQNFSLDRKFDAGAYHYGLIFLKF